jgi:hypothetical protein
MSGGRRHRPSLAEGDHPACTNEVRKAGDTAEDARSESGGLGLDGTGAAGPQSKKMLESQPKAGRITLREGSSPDGGDDGTAAPGAPLCGESRARSGIAGRARFRERIWIVLPQRAS